MNTALALKHSASVSRSHNRDRIVDDGIQSQMVRTRTRLIKLPPHRRVLKLELIACVALRKDSAWTSNERGRIWKVSCRSREGREAVVIQREHWRG